jgi:hypothetical protein
MSLENSAQKAAKDITKLSDSMVKDEFARATGGKGDGVNQE